MTKPNLNFEISLKILIFYTRITIIFHFYIYKSYNYFIFLELENKKLYQTTPYLTNLFYYFINKILTFYIFTMVIDF